MAEKGFSQLLNEARGRDSYWVEKAKLQFAEELYELMDRRGVTRSELAALIGASPGSVTRTLRGDANLTIEAMVKLVRCLQGKLEIEVLGLA